MKRRGDTTTTSFNGFTGNLYLALLLIKSKESSIDEELKTLWRWKVERNASEEGGRKWWRIKEQGQIIKHKLDVSTNRWHLPAAADHRPVKSRVRCPKTSMEADSVVTANGPAVCRRKETICKMWKTQDFVIVFIHEIRKSTPKESSRPTKGFFFRTGNRNRE